jgi:hypothetical protein
LQTATLFPGGQVLIAGGGNGDGSPSGVLTNAELYGLVTRPSVAVTPSPVPDKVIVGPPNAPVLRPPSLLTLAGYLVVFTVCMVILTACAVVLLAAWLAFVLIRRR